MDDLFQQGVIAYRAGKKDEARKIFISIVKQSPGNERAWGRLYDVAKNDQERTHCLKQILRINPKNEKAKQLLDTQHGPNNVIYTPKPAIEPKSVSWTESIVQPQKNVQSSSTSSFNSIATQVSASVEQLENAETEKPDPLDLLFALFSSFGAALIAAFLWYGLVVTSGKLFSAAAILVGWIVAQATIFGARRKRGCLIQMISVFATGFAMLLSEYLIVRYVVVQSLLSKGYTNIPLFLPLGTILDSIALGVSKSPITLLFWGIALWEAFAFSVKRRVK